MSMNRYSKILDCDSIMKAFFVDCNKDLWGINKVLLLLNKPGEPSFLFQNLSSYNTSSNHRKCRPERT